MEPPAHSPTETESENSSQPWDSDIPRSGRDRSYMVIGAWTVGLVLVGVVMFRFGGSGTLTAAPPQQTLVPPTPLEKPANPAPARRQPAGGVPGDVSAASPIAAGPSLDETFKQARAARQAAARSAISVVPNQRASYVSGDHEHQVGYVNNDSGLTITGWKATVTYYDQSNRVLGSKSVSSTEPIAPGQSKSFGIDHTHIPGTVRASLQLRDVRFKD